LASSLLFALFLRIQKPNAPSFLDCDEINVFDTDAMTASSVYKPVDFGLFAQREQSDETFVIIPVQIWECVDGFAVWTWLMLPIPDLR